MTEDTPELRKAQLRFTPPLANLFESHRSSSAMSSMTSGNRRFSHRALTLLPVRQTQLSRLPPIPSSISLPLCSVGVEGSVQTFERSEVVVAAYRWTEDFRK
jgi:hypothetical protein